MGFVGDIGTVIGGAGSLIGGIGGLFSKGNHRFRYRAKLMDEISQHQENRRYKKAVEFWNMKNAYDSPSQQLYRMRVAGINPFLEGGMPSPSGDLPNAPTGNPSMPSLETGSRIGDITGASLAMAQIANLNAKTRQVENTTPSKSQFDRQLETNIALEQAKVFDQKQMGEIHRMEATFQSAIYEDRVDQFKTKSQQFKKDLELTCANIDKTLSDKNLTDENVKLVGEKVKECIYNQALLRVREQAERAGINLTTSQIQKIGEEIQNIQSSTAYTDGLKDNLVYVARDLRASAYQKNASGAKATAEKRLAEKQAKYYGYKTVSEIVSNYSNSAEHIAKMIVPFLP